MNIRIALLAATVWFGATLSLGAKTKGSLFARRYQEGEHMTYLMKGINENWRYQIEASGVVEKDAKGRWVEEYAWSHLVSNGKHVALPTSGARYRELLSLDPARPPFVENLGSAPRVLIGPITDLGTFYVDLWLARRLGNKLARSGDHALVKIGKPGSWADGKRVLTGESAVDFHFRLLSVNRTASRATLLVQHLPPAQLEVPLPAPWMRAPFGPTPNNWVEVKRKGEAFVAAAGRETFDVQMTVNLANGEILSAQMKNRVRARVRDCRDAALKHCDIPKLQVISRQIGISLQN